MFEGISLGRIFDLTHRLWLITGFRKQVIVAWNVSDMSKIGVTEMHLGG